MSELGRGLEGRLYQERKVDEEWIPRASPVSTATIRYGDGDGKSCTPSLSRAGVCSKAAIRLSAHRLGYQRFARHMLHFQMTERRQLAGSVLRSQHSGCCRMNADDFFLLDRSMAFLVLVLEFLLFGDRVNSFLRVHHSCLPADSEGSFLLLHGLWNGLWLFLFFLFGLLCLKASMT